MFGSLQKDLRNVNTSSVRAAFPRRESPLIYEPANIQFAYEYIYLETIYSSLVEYNDRGEIQPSVARKFWWDKGELHLEIRDDLKTIDGQVIGPDDVVFSLKRVMLLGGNTHGNLLDILCGSQGFSSIEQACPGLRAKGHVVTLSPRHETPFLTAMLTGIDFAIVPRASTDPKTLRIVDMRNTTGPMYLESVSADGVVKLKANHSHFNYHTGRPEEITLIPALDERTQKSRALEMFEDNKVDLITTIDSVASEDVIQYHIANPDTTDLHSSMDIRIFLVRFSSLALKSVRRETRFSIGKALVQALHDTFKNKKSLKATDQIVPIYGEGGLDPKLAASFRNQASNSDFDHNQAIRVYLIRLPDVEMFRQAVLKVFPKAVFIDSNEKKLPNWGDDDSDLIISGPDMGFVEDISLYSYALKGGIFRAPEGADAWLNLYMQNMNKEERIAMIRDLHIYNLENGLAFPVFAAPYVALSRKPWMITLPKMFANHPLWQILYQP